MKADDKQKLWETYRKSPTPEMREQIILEYAPLVKVVAGRLSMYLGYNVEYEDLVSYGIFGLIDAIDKFDMQKDVKFRGICQPAYSWCYSGPDPKDGLDTANRATEAKKDRRSDPQY